MELVVIGMVALWAGMKFASNWRWLPSVRLDVPENPWRWHYLRIVLLVSALMKAVVSFEAWGGGSRQILVNIEVMVPAVTFTILLRSYLQGRALGVDKVLLAGYFLVALMLGMSSGWMGNVVGLGVICVGTYVLERHKFPIAAILMILPVILFLQPGKAKFRERYWQRGPTDTYSDYGERIGFWLDTSAKLWAHAITDSSGNGLRAVTDPSLSRVSLLQQTGNVIEMTPGQVPFQHGRLYSYVLITWIPRFVWPGKPSMSDANQWYQLAYHINSPKQLESVSIAVGNLTESYINFGWFGPLLVMSCLGFFLGAFQRIFLSASSGLLLNSIGVALFPGLLVLEAQMAEYVSGIVQQILVAIIVLAPILQLVRHTKNRRSREILASQRFTGREETTIR
jgi:hypothetical protein